MRGPSPARGAASSSGETERVEGGERGPQEFFLRSRDFPLGKTYLPVFFYIIRGPDAECLLVYFIPNEPQRSVSRSDVPLLSRARKNRRADVPA